MPTQRIAFALACCFFILLSCNNKKDNNNSTNKLAAANFDTVLVQPDESVDIAGYAANFMDNITQTFTAEARKISVIIAKQGLKVTVNPAVLEKENGDPVDSRITVSIIELTNSTDLFKSNAATISDGRLLASGGSYFVGMTCGGQKLHIKQDKSMQVQFPKLKSDDMQLFYGQRNEEGNMNWVKTGVQLEPQEEMPEEISFTDSNRYTLNDYGPRYELLKKVELKLYRNLSEEVYFYDRKMSIKELVDTVNKHNTKLYIDTVFAWPKSLAEIAKDKRIDTNYFFHLYGPSKQFFLKTCKDAQKEKELDAAQSKKQQEAVANWKPQTLAGQLKKYYAPSAVQSLGWLNCDFFYRNEEKLDVPVELPITFNKGNIQYFVIFNTFNGLLNGKLNYNETKKGLINLPAGQSVTLVAFTKNNGQLFQCKEMFVVQKDKPVQLNFKEISAEEMTTIFGKNVRI
jgi:hypothetical protein